MFNPYLPSRVIALGIATLSVSLVANASPGAERAPWESWDRETVGRAYNSSAAVPEGDPPATVRWQSPRGGRARVRRWLCSFSCYIFGLLFVLFSSVCRGSGGEETTQAVAGSARFMD